MVIILDSGSSKTDIAILSPEGDVSTFQTKGFNPYYQPKSDLVSIIERHIWPYVNTKVSRIVFYGSGASSSGNKRVISTAFNEHFAQAKIEIESDVRNCLSPRLQIICNEIW